MVIFDAKRGDLILMGLVSLMLFEFVRIPKARLRVKAVFERQFQENSPESSFQLHGERFVKNFIL